MTNDMLIHSYELVEPVTVRFKVESKNTPGKIAINEGVFTEIRSIILPDKSVEFNLITTEIKKIGIE